MANLKPAHAVSRLNRLEKKELQILMGSCRPQLRGYVPTYHRRLNITRYRLRGELRF
jgi:hypothetical protein